MNRGEIWLVDWKAGFHTQEPACAGESIINFLSNEEPVACRGVLHLTARNARFVEKIPNDILTEIYDIVSGFTEIE